MSAVVEGIKAGAELAAELERTRTRIVELKAELQITRATPLPLDAALRRVQSMVSAAALPRLDLSSFMSDANGPPRTDLSWAISQDANTLLLALAGPQIGAALEAQLRGTYGSGIRTLPAVERQKRIATIEDAIFDAEVLEERLVRRLERAGLEPDRRGDARPEVVLMLEEED